MASEDVALRIALKDEISSGLGNITGSLAKIGLGFGAFELGRRLVTGIFDATVELDKQMARLSGAVRRANLDWAQSEPAINNFTDALESTKGVIDDYSRESLVRALDYTKDLGKAMDITRVAADLAAAKDMDLVAATDLLGKAFLGKTEMFGRYGIVIDDAIPKGEKFVAVMAQVNERFGGAAAAQLDTYETKLKVLKDRFSDVGKAIGNAFEEKDESNLLKDSIDGLSRSLGAVKKIIEGRWQELWQDWLSTIRSVDENARRAAVGLSNFTGEWKALSDETEKTTRKLKEQVAEWWELASMGQQLATIAHDLRPVKSEDDEEHDALVKKIAFHQELVDLAASMAPLISEEDEAIAKNAATITEQWVPAWGQVTEEAERIAKVLGITLPNAMQGVRTATVAVKKSFLDMTGYFEKASQRAVSSIVGNFFRLKEEASNVWIAMAMDFARYFAEEILSIIATKLIPKMLDLLSLIFDTPANDRMAMKQGADFAGFFTRGVTEHLSANFAPSMTGALTMPHSSQLYIAQASQPSAGYSGGNIVINISGNMTPDFIQRNIVDTIQRAANNGFGGFKYDAGFKTGNSVIAFN
mgnify:CR=1 FL=1